MKHNISITVDQKLFREIEEIREREKRSSFIEHLIIEGLRTYKNSNQQTETIPITPVIGLKNKKKEGDGLVYF
jgi:metal-responsive CopG/Arc/MetJ family transcriptional regulator